MKKLIKQRAYRDGLCLSMIVVALGFLFWDAARTEAQAGWMAAPHYLVFWLGAILTIVGAGAVVFFDTVQALRQQRSKTGERQSGQEALSEVPSQAARRF